MLIVKLEPRITPEADAPWRKARKGTKGFLGKSFLAFLCLFLLFFPTQGVRAGSYPQHLAEGLKNSFDNRNIIPLAGGIWLASFLDEPVHEHLTGGLLPGPLVKPTDFWGQGPNWLISSGYIFWHGIENDLRQRDIWQQFQYHTEAYFLNAVFTFAVKDLTHRLRPDGSNHHSFPSGHTSSSFVVAAMLNQMYGERVGLPAYVIASLTGMQRIHGEKHWLSDVLAGALLGTLIGDGFGELIRREQNISTPVFSISFKF